MAPKTVLDKALPSRTYAEVRVALLRQRGRSLTAIADRLGVHRSFVSHVNAGRKRSRPVEREIAKDLGLSVREAFPERPGNGERAA